MLIFVMLLALSIVTSIVMEQYNTRIDAVLGTRSEVLFTEETETAFNHFIPPEDVLNADGSFNSREFIKKMIKYGRRQAAEGCVLLKNKNGALPLANERNITLLGARSHTTLQGAGMGMSISGPVITLEDALSASRTDFKNQQKWASNIPANASLDNYDYSSVGGDTKQ